MFLLNYSNIDSQFPLIRNFLVCRFHISQSRVPHNLGIIRHQIYWLMHSTVLNDMLDLQCTDLEKVDTAQHTESQVAYAAW